MRCLDTIQIRIRRGHRDFGGYTQTGVYRCGKRAPSLVHWELATWRGRTHVTISHLLILSFFFPPFSSSFSSTPSFHSLPSLIWVSSILPASLSSPSLSLSTPCPCVLFPLHSAVVVMMSLWLSLLQAFNNIMLLNLFV